MYMKFLESDCDSQIHNIYQTEFFKAKIQNCVSSTKTLHLPLFIYFDDFEVNNSWDLMPT